MLSPFLFAIYLDDVVSRVCTHVCGSVLSIVLYADDIIILSPSVQVLQELLVACENELSYLDMALNVKKSCCMRIGQRCNVNCAAIVTVVGDKLPWVNEIRYLAMVYIFLNSNTLNVRSIMLKGHFIGPQMPFLARLVALPQRR